MNIRRSIEMMVDRLKFISTIHHISPYKLEERHLKDILEDYDKMLSLHSEDSDIDSVAPEDIENMLQMISRKNDE